MYKKAALIFPLALISQLSLADWVKDATQQNENQVIQLRQHIHEYPELGNMEFKTSALVQKELKSYGIQVKTGCPDCPDGPLHLTGCAWHIGIC